MKLRKRIVGSGRCFYTCSQDDTRIGVGTVNNFNRFMYYHMTIVSVYYYYSVYIRKVHAMHSTFLKRNIYVRNVILRISVPTTKNFII